jgi:hypothetical protein
MNNTARQGLTIAIILVLLCGISIAASRYAQKLPSPAQKALGIKTTKVISYKGEEGKTVLEILKRDHKVDVSESEYGVVVHSIDGTAQTDSAIWVYYVDGTPAAESADKAVTKNSQTIEWKYENF